MRWLVKNREVQTVVRAKFDKYTNPHACVLEGDEVLTLCTRETWDAEFVCGHVEDSWRNIEASSDGRRWSGDLSGPLPSDWCGRVERHARQAERGLEAIFSDKWQDRGLLAWTAHRTEESEVFFSAEDDPIRALERMSAMRESVLEVWNVDIAQALRFLRGRERGRGGANQRCGGRTSSTSRNCEFSSMTCELRSVVCHSVCLEAHLTSPPPPFPLHLPFVGRFAFCCVYRLLRTVCLFFPSVGHILSSSTPSRFCVWIPCVGL